MAQLYDRADIYDLLENEDRYQIVRKHWEMILKNRNIQTLLDVSIGSGNMTIPLMDHGIQVYGSDLSAAMLEKCSAKARHRGHELNLRVCDFRELTEHFAERFDCVASTGNSLGYVKNHEIPGVLEQMDALIRPGGWLYFDLRNWDKILKTKQRFYTYNPAFDGETRINLVQVWDHLPDGAMDFNLLYTFERNNRIVQQEHFVEHYHPVRRQLLTDKLLQMGYTDFDLRLMPAQFGPFDPERSDWYCLIARKPM